MRHPKDMTDDEMRARPWFRITSALVTVAAVVLVALAIIALVSGCTAPNLPPPIPPPASAAPPTLVPAPPSQVSTTSTTLSPTPSSSSPATVTIDDGDGGSVATPVAPTTTPFSREPYTPGNIPMFPTPQGDPGQPGVPAAQTADVVSVYDGDTLTVTLNGEKESVRPLGMDAPEKENSNLGISGECFAVQSTDALRGLVTAHQVQLIIDPTQGDASNDYRDKYGRLLRYVEVGDGDQIRTSTTFIDISEYQIRNGNAWVYEQYPVSRTPLYQAAQVQAQQEHDGLWAACE